MRSNVLSAIAVLAAALSALPAAAQSAPIAPEKYFGFRMGDDRKSLDWPQVVGYFQKLDSSSDRVLVREYGKSTEGRPLIVAYLSDAANLSALDRYQRIQARLADPRKTPAPEAEQLFHEGKAIVMITCSIHSTEVGATLTAIEFAYRLATDESEKFRAIRENTILLLVPSLNPDGLDLVTNWYRKTLDTPYEGTAPPELYQKYVGHDNNRDWYFFTQAETRATVAELHNVWHPQIVYDVHQQGAYASRMFLPPWQDPIDPNIDPVLAQMCNAFGMGMAMDLTAAGRKGVVVDAIYDFWSPARHYQAYHGGMRILSEAASARLYSPITVRPDQIADRARGYNPNESAWNYLEPWMGGTWRLRDIVDEEMVAFESLAWQAAMRREDLLRNFYGIGKRAASRRLPYAFVVPGAQRDPGATRVLLEKLAFGQVETERASAAFEAGGERYPAGSYVIRMQQPYSSFAKTLLERQDYPNLRQYPGGPPAPPYDVTAQTLPLLMGVQVDTIERPFTAQLEPARGFAVRYSGGGEALPASDTDSWKKVNAAWRAGRPVYRDAKDGHFLVGASSFSEPLRQPRIGLYKSYVPNIDEGWTRWVFDQFGFAYASLKNEEIVAGGLRKRYDVIVFADQSPGVIRRGYSANSMPAEYTGGLGDEGARALREFAEQGGSLVFLNRACNYGVEALKLDVKNVTAGVPAGKLYVPGSLLRVELEQDSPLTIGLPKQIAIWDEESPAWELPKGSLPGAVSVATFPSEGLLESGWLLGEDVLARRSALLDVPVGEGRVILFGMRPQYRGQSYLTYKLLFNALVDAPAGARGRTHNVSAGSR